MTIFEFSSLKRSKFFVSSPPPPRCTFFISSLATPTERVHVQYEFVVRLCHVNILRLYVAFMYMYIAYVISIEATWTCTCMYIIYSLAVCLQRVSLSPEFYHRRRKNTRCWQSASLSSDYAFNAWVIAYAMPSPWREIRIVHSSSLTGVPSQIASSQFLFAFFLPVALLRFLWYKSSILLIVLCNYMYVYMIYTYSCNSTVFT